MHAYQFDLLGRVLHDGVTTLGTGIDGLVRRTSTTYEVRGMREKVTHYDHATVGSVVNEVVFEYGDLGQLVKEYQEHEGAQDVNTLYVEYHFDESASGGKFTKGVRPSSVRYPNGRLVHLTYGSADSTADVLNRLAAIQDDSGGSPGDTLASYTYLGLGTIVIEDYPQPDVRLEYFFDSSYAGFDRFGRVVDQRWYDYGASADRDRYTYGYDRASNRLYRENTTASGKDEFYSYDGVNRLETFDRGDLNAGKTAISGTPVREEDWNLDMTGNWAGYLQKTSGTTDLDQDRSHNEVNEITDISETTGTAWATPVHDRAGNMTGVPKPASLSSSLTLKWDAWNRLVEAKDGQTVIGIYEYDALHRRIKRHIDSQAPDNPNGVDTYVHYFYNSAWQVLETRDTTTESAPPETLQPDWQYVWSPRYIDAPVLRDRNTDADGLCDDERLYYLNDANFNVTTLVDTSGDAVERYLYEPYGKVTMYDGSWANVRSASSCANVVLYTGRERDPETGLCHCRRRHYSSEFGRFLSRDPNEFMDGVGLYSYARSNPAVNGDPSGSISVTLVSNVPDQHTVPCGWWVRGVWDFRLSEPAPCRGWIVQQVHVRCTITDCMACAPFSSSAPTQEFSYLEAWPVPIGSTGVGVRDTGRVHTHNDSCGYWRQSGEIKFFCNRDLTPVVRWRRGVVYGSGRCTTTPGVLWSFPTDPGWVPFWWWVGSLRSEGHGRRYISAYWNCCPCRPQFVQHVIQPRGTETMQCSKHGY